MAFIIKDWFKVATGFLKPIPTYLPSIDISHIVNRQKEKAEEKQHSEQQCANTFFKKDDINPESTKLVVNLSRTHTVDHEHYEYIYTNIVIMSTRFTMILLSWMNRVFRRLLLESYRES